MPKPQRPPRTSPHARPVYGRLLGVALLIGSPLLSHAGPPGPGRMSIEVEDAQLSGVLRMISEVSGQGFVLDAAHDREVTVRLIDVPWDAALHAILALEGLMAVPVSPGVLRVAPLPR